MSTNPTDEEIYEAVARWALDGTPSTSDQALIATSVVPDHEEDQ